MPEKKTIRRAQKDKAEGKAPSTQAGEFVREEVHHVREGKHGARNAKQAIAIGLSKARRAGVAIPERKASASKGKKRSSAKKRTSSSRPRRRIAARKPTSARRARATSKALKREGHTATSGRALSRQASASARRRSSASRSAAAKKAARTKGPRVRRASAKKAARTRARRAS